MPPRATATLNIHILSRQVHAVNVHLPGRQPVNGHPWPRTPTELQQVLFHFRTNPALHLLKPHIHTIHSTQPTHIGLTTAATTTIHTIRMDPKSTRRYKTITWSEFMGVFNDIFFLIQVQQAKREQFQTLQQGNSFILEYQMRFVALSRYAPYVVTNNAMMVEYFIHGLRLELQNAVIPLMCRTMEEVAQRAATLERLVRTCQAGDSGSFRLPQQSSGVSKGKAPAGSSSSGFSKWGSKLKKIFRGQGGDHQ
ncbi:hypothetical protein Taro_007856 [Colocasia esculenta]|uniref:Retrotransposon gag domain-containing protein n=1 Tax=Colocasia esculenta TaxID=4460 RepID=A0A843U0S7_COLES|nr:hypothetical protein [Colocasia esculenta]